MSINPWIKFYPRDWRGDQALRAVSIAARGLWIECLCIMHEATPYGHLILNGQRVTNETLARMAGCSLDEVQALLAELSNAGVFSTNSKGVVFSRRMTKDFKRAKMGQISVKKRWCQDTENKDEKAIPNRPPSRPPNRAPITQNPDTRNQIKEDNPLTVIIQEKDAIDLFPDATQTGSDSIPVQRETALEDMPNHRGCRLPDGFPAQDWLEWAAEQGHSDPKYEAERFRDYWLGRSGKDGRKADWPATWRNWVRRSIENGKNNNGKRINDKRQYSKQRDDDRAAILRVVGLE